MALEYLVRRTFMAESTDPNIEPDIMGQMLRDDPRRRPMTRARAAKLARLMGKTVDEIMIADRIQRANWDASEDPEDIAYSADEVAAILEASPEYNRG